MGIEQEINFLTKDYMKDVDKIEEYLYEDILKSVTNLTPYKTGNAQKHWIIEKSGDNAVVSNNVSYIEYLEYGTRRQRAHAMVRLTLLKVDSFLKSAINRVNISGK